MAEAEVNQLIEITELVESAKRAVDLQDELLEKMKEFDKYVELLEMQGVPHKGDSKLLEIMRDSCRVHRGNLHRLLTNYARFAGEEFDTLEKVDRSYVKRLKAHREAMRIAAEVELREAIEESI